MPKLKVPVSSEDHIQGDKNALITFVEYGDYECPFCKKAYPIAKKIEEIFHTHVRFVFRNFPLLEIHRHAEMAAEAAEFADTYKCFWEMHYLIFENQNKLSQPLLLELGTTLNLPSEELDIVIQKKTFASKIRNDFLGGVKSGVNGTPTFFINDERFNGSPYELENTIREAVEKLEFRRF